MLVTGGEASPVSISIRCQLQIKGHPLIGPLITELHQMQLVKAGRPSPLLIQCKAIRFRYGTDMPDATLQGQELPTSQSPAQPRANIARKQPSPTREPPHAAKCHPDQPIQRIGLQRIIRRAGKKQTPHMSRDNKRRRISSIAKTGDLGIAFTGKMEMSRGIGEEGLGRGFRN